MKLSKEELIKRLGDYNKQLKAFINDQEEDVDTTDIYNIMEELEDLTDDLDKEEEDV